jgi:hypothetical protein
MKCPYCEEECRDYEDWNAHALAFHPEKTSLEDTREARILRYWNTASELTSVVFLNQCLEDTTKEAVVETFRYILREVGMIGE